MIRILGSACTSRLSQYIGQKSEAKAKVVLKLTVMLLFLCGLVPAVPYAIFRHPLIRLFTDKEEVVDMAASMTLFVAINDFGMRPVVYKKIMISTVHVYLLIIESKQMLFNG